MEYGILLLRISGTRDDDVVQGTTINIHSQKNGESGLMTEDNMKTDGCHHPEERWTNNAVLPVCEKAVVFRCRTGMGVVLIVELRQLQLAKFSWCFVSLKRKSS